MIQPFANRGSRRRPERSLKPGETPCAICGRGVREPWPFIAVVVEGGARFALANEIPDENDPGYMGAWPIGSDCARQYPAIAIRWMAP